MVDFDFKESFDVIKKSLPKLDVNTPQEAREFLMKEGSIAAPGWMRPEGAVMYCEQAKKYYKVIIDK